MNATQAAWQDSPYNLQPLPAELPGPGPEPFDRLPGTLRAHLPEPILPSLSPSTALSAVDLRQWLAQQIRRTREAFPRRTCRACGRRSHYAAMTFEHGWFCDRSCAQHHWCDPTR